MDAGAHRSAAHVPEAQPALHSGSEICRRPALASPDVHKRRDQRLHVLFGMVGGGRDPQPFLPAWDGRVVDRLDVDGVFAQQQLADATTQMSVADDQRKDMAWGVGHR